jgi:dTDP-4-dehydrorhamnose 3,5-epimerase
VKIEELAVPDAYLLTPRIFQDDRGSFLEWYRHEALTELLGYPLTLAQANCSTSVKGVVRGVHYADVPPGQAKYVTCVQGAVLDVIVDLRVGSPTFGRSEAVRLDDADRRAVYLAEGLGHGFCALSDSATVVYLCSTVYTPGVEHGVHPLDPELGLPWPTDLVPVLSDKDAAAPTLEQARSAGALPTMDACRSRYDVLRRQAQGSAQR